MSQNTESGTEKPHEPTPQKLSKAREKGEIARSTDIAVAASYAGLLLAALAAGPKSLAALGLFLSVLLEQSADIAVQVFEGPAATPILGMMERVAIPMAPWFALPMAIVLLSIVAQRAFVLTPSKLTPKLNRISLVANAQNKFGRRGLVEFLKSLTKLVVFSAALGMYLRVRFPDIQSVLFAEARTAVALMGRFCVEFLVIAVLVSLAIGLIDLVWQNVEHRRKNRMSHKEIKDETKETEGDPHIKQQRRQKAQEIAMNQMAAKVADADVVMVNPTHYAVALKWSRAPGSAPECVAKGQDEAAAAIRQVAQEHGVPVQHDPPATRALYATVKIGETIHEEHFRAVAAAIRFAEKMRRRARERAF